jgi:hypothetical protein
VAFETPSGGGSAGSGALAVQAVKAKKTVIESANSMMKISEFLKRLNDILGTSEVTADV